jgi:Nuclear cap-binding protein subunit 3
MSTFDIKSYYERYASTKDSLVVVWINDSACTVKFESEDMARKAYYEQALSHS